MVKILFINGECNCNSITPNPVTKVGLSAYLTSPSDSNGNKCIPSQSCIYSLSYSVSDNIGIIGTLFKPNNFNSSGATLAFYDGNTVTGTPYMIVDGSYDGKDTVNIISSLGKNITIVFNVSNQNKDIPTFTYVSSSTINIRTTTPIPTTTTPIPSPPYPIIPDSFKSEGDIFIYVDLSSNVTLTSQIGEEIVNALYISIDENSFHSRIFLTLATDVQILSFGWKNSKLFLKNQFNNLQNMYTGISSSTIEWNKFGSIISSAFNDSISQRPNVLRTLIFLTDNNNQMTDNGISQYKQIINQNDIHPVLINIDSSKDVSTFTKILETFNGDNTNQIVKINYNNITDLFENYLFNSNIMCNINSLNFSGTDSFQFPIQPLTGTIKKNYCNYMNYTIKCVSPSLTNITITLYEYDFEANGDYLTVYNDQGIIQAVFTGTSVTNSTEIIKNTTFVEFILSTNNHRIYPGVNIKFSGCTIV
ncbi:von Willebrand factor, type A domain-containing protein [Strongyloides ratti]|uniref:von Willebrand factor, type A domain-containing protein n=1 Tax=Strongyloides ratti TaxID=34506 RepID=A0A090L113_STRRB|nr:von Willebrand factor, type A domain-containing protein [Strongyloides ratti]CEF61792.1 von Willebrand factor, type A domain-containing protein [Strongyloides ratti]